MRRVVVGKVKLFSKLVANFSGGKFGAGRPAPSVTIHQWRPPPQLA